MTLSLLLIGVGTSLFNEAASWLTKKLSGTPLQGFGAYLIVLAASFVAAAVKIAWSGVPIVHFKDILPVFLQVYAVAELWFNVIATKVGLEVKADLSPQS